MFGRKKVAEAAVQSPSASSSPSQTEENKAVKAGASAPSGGSEAAQAAFQQQANQAEQPEVVKAQSKPDEQGTEAEAMRRRVAAGSKLVSAAFGEIVTLLMRAPGYKHYTLADLEWLVVPPLLTNQFTLAEARSKETGLTAPVGVALWARVSDEVDQRLSGDLSRPIRLRPDEWNSGSNLWLIDAVGPAKIVQALLQRLRNEDFKGQDFKLRARDDKGEPIVKVISATPSQQ